MAWYHAIIGTPTEKKREQYKKLYNDLNDYLTDFNKKLKGVEESVDQYSFGRQTMQPTVIPEDVFSTSEINVYQGVEKLRERQVADAKELEKAVDAAYQRYLYYARLAVQEKREKEAEERHEKRK